MIRNSIRSEEKSMLDSDRSFGKTAYEMVRTSTRFCGTAIHEPSRYSERVFWFSASCFCFYLWGFSAFHSKRDRTTEILFLSPLL